MIHRKRCIAQTEEIIVKEDYEVLCIVPNFDYLQIRTHGCCYTCTTKLIDGESYFRFKGKWHRTKDYTTPHTLINNIGGPSN